MAQQDYVPRYSAFGGFAYVNTPKRGLVQRGYDLEFGVNVTRWLTLRSIGLALFGQWDTHGGQISPSGDYAAVEVDAKAHTRMVRRASFVPKNC